MKKTKLILLIIIIIIIVVGLGVFMNKAEKPGKFDEFAKALKDRGAQFYGAFWCTHCQAQKAEFGSSKKYLPYIECSNPNQTPVQICTDKKIESFPTWMFKDGITINSTEEPLTCNIKSQSTTAEDAICKQIASDDFKTYIFPSYKFYVKSSSSPIVDKNIWKFDSDSRAVGEIPLPFLAEQIGFNLTQ